MYFYINYIFYIHSFSMNLANSLKNTYLWEIGLFLENMTPVHNFISAHYSVKAVTKLEKLWRSTHT
jgi:hypothetical protein